MRRALALLLAVAASARAEDASEHAFVEVSSSRDTYYVGEEVPLLLRAGYDATWFKEHAVPLVRSTLDIPIQVDAPWLRHDSEIEPLTRTHVSVNGERRRIVLAAAEIRGGTQFSIFTISDSDAPHRPGERVYAAPLLRFAYATRFAEDALGTRVPVDRTDARVEGKPLRIAVLALPAEGRPAGFTGAIGRFMVSASLGTTPAADGHLQLELRVEGDGNLAAIPAPRPALEGFHVYGVTRAQTGRLFHYDIAPLRADVTTVPAIEFAYFDPTPPAQYRVARTAPIPITSRPQPAEPVAPPAESQRRFPWFLLTLAAGAALFVVVWRRERRKQTAVVDPLLARTRTAAAAFRAHAPGDAADAFTRFVAACLDCPPAAVVSRDLVPRIEAAGVPADLARRAAALLERLVSARYGGASDAAADEAEAASIVSSWEAAASAPRAP